LHAGAILPAQQMNLHDPGLGSSGAGDHLCFLYESEDEKQSTLVTFVREGLARHERCLLIGSPDDHAEIVGTLVAAGLPVVRAVERGALVLATQDETYGRTGRFDPDDMLAFLDERIDEALADGFVGLRATGEASTTIADELWPEVLRYEAQLNEYFARRPFLALCRFHAACVRPDRVQDLLRTHPVALVRGDLCANPFYERSELVLSDDSRARLAWQLHQLRTFNRSRRLLEVTAASRHEMLSMLADDLADPLFALKREVHALGAALGEMPAPERLEAAHRHLRRLSSAVEQARDVARLQRAEPCATDDEGDLVALVRDVADRHRPALATAGCAITLDAPDVVPGAWDRVTVDRLVSTVLLNAAARGGGRSVTIVVRAHEDRVTLTFGPPRDNVGDNVGDKAGDLAGDPAGDESGAAEGGFPLGSAYTVELPRAPLRTRS
jgi:signal transduction histidine kinase